MESVKRGAGIYAENIDNVDIDNCEFTFMTTEDDGAAIYIRDLNDDFILKDSSFTCKDSGSYVVSTVRSELENSVSIPNGGAIYIRNGGGSGINSDDNDFEYCFTSER